ncbi:ATP-binding protein [archaeon]|nr:ATP-binding protein [archaeon]
MAKEDERIEETEVSEEADLMEEALGESKQKELKEMADKNEKDRVEEEEKEEEDEKVEEESEDDSDKDEEETDDDIDKDAKEEKEEEEDDSEEEGSEEEEETEEEKPKAPSKEEIEKTILEKAAMASGSIPIGEKLEFLNDKERNAVFIGRKASIYKKYGFEAALQIGRVHEKEFENQDVYLDSMNPHVIFVCGARGSGKSYVLGVIAEELAEKNKNVGVIVVDPIGVFWSMKFPNKEEKEVEKLREWGLEPKGLSTLKVFIPEGVKDQVPKSTYDSGFSLQPSLLTGEDWALTFGVDRFSVSGLLLDKVLKKVEKGYKDKETNKKVPGKGKNYSLNDLIRCLENDSELNSREKGYKQDSLRAIASRFDAAKNWGIFHENGTPLGKLSRENQLTILDTSFLEDNVTALVIGILARRLLAARKISTRKEAASKFKSLSMNDLLELEIPPTWLFIDEAHTLIPSGNEVTPATRGLIEYVKQGRRPGLSLVFATQQPSAINTKVLSQLDVIISHKLIFDDDIKAVFKRTPTIIPKKYRAPNFIKTLPVGVAITGDRREETSRAFVMGIRPRKSQHEGRDAETTQLTEKLDKKQVQAMAVEILMRDVKKEDLIDMEKAGLAVDTLNNKYGSNVEIDDVLDKLEEKGLVVTDDSIMAEGYTQEEAVDELSADEEDEEKEEEESEEEDEAEEDETPTELLSLPIRISNEQARKQVERIRKKKLFGLLGNAERIESIQTKFFPIWHIKFDVRTKGKEFISRECFINSKTGEFMHFQDGAFIESKGLSYMNKMNEEEIGVLKSLQQKELLIEEIMAQTELDEAKARRVLKKLIEKKIVAKVSDKKSGKEVYWVQEKFDLPPNERHDLLSSLGKLPFVKAQALSMEREDVSKDEAAESLRKLWPSVVVNKVQILYKPVWHIVLSLDAKEREILIDAVNGKIISS